MLLGRNNESKALQALLAAARNGEGGAIVVHGEAGIGKTALIEHVVALVFAQHSTFDDRQLFPRFHNAVYQALR